MNDRLSALRAAGVLSALDEHLARTLCSIAGESRESVRLAVALVSHQVARGHVCVSLPALVRGELPVANDPEVDPELLRWPALDDWSAALANSRLVGPADANTPLVFDAQQRLYLRKHFAHERDLGSELLRRIQAPELSVDGARLAEGLARLFPKQGPDLQRTAAELALRRPFSVISGGPGTGKTATVVKILALVIEQALHAEKDLPRMLLLAPTGKAAVRVVESIRNAKATLDCSDAVRAAIPDTASTIHRALFATLRRASREPSDTPPELAVDLVLVDEASMVDLALMARLFSVIPRDARVILLGDKHQLASVEAGAVLGDICGAGKSPEALAQAHAPVVHLTESYRYSAQSGIGELARAINAGDAARTLEILGSEAFPDVVLCEPPKGKGLGARLRDDALRGYSPCLQADDPAQALALFERFRVLCAHRRGPRGVEDTSAQLLRVFAERDLVLPTARHFARAPILITENDYRNRLWNGDIGFVLAPEAELPLTAAFLSEHGELRRLGVARLPPHESALAMSIHKSQGSEVDEVAIVLPDEPSLVLTRELLYTGVTRARKRVVIHGHAELVAAAVKTSIARSSGLADALYGREDPSLR